MPRVVGWLVAIVAAFGVGIAVGRLSAPTRGPAAPDDATHRVRVKLASAMLARTIADATDAAEDDPARPAVESPGWSDRVPADWRAVAVERVVLDVLDTCDVDGQVLGLDCTEPPCAAVVAGAAIAAAEIAACPAWTDVYGDAPLRRSFVSACESGLTVAFVAPAWPVEVREGDPGWVRAVDEAWGARVDALRAVWCAPG